MKIVYLHQYFNTPAMPGGTRSYEMARRWVQRGHEVHVVTSRRVADSRDRRWRDETIDGITVHWRLVPYANQMNPRQRIRAFLAFAMLAGHRARALRGDVIFATSTPLTIILPALWAAFGRQAPIVFEVRDLWPELPIAFGALRNPLLKVAARRLELIAYRQSARVVALSPGMAEGVLRRGVDPSAVTIAPNACDLELFSVPASAGLAYRAANKWLGSRDLVVYCGALGQINDVEYLVRLAAESARRGRTTAFAVYGDGINAARVRGLAAALAVLDVNFFMLGEIAKEQVPSVLSAADICTVLFAPLKEMEANSANKFFDGLAAGRAVAINYGGWQAELIHREGIGLVLPPTDIEGAVNIIEAYLDRQEARRTVEYAARRVAREQFSRDVIAQRVLDTITDAVALQGRQGTE